MIEVHSWTQAAIAIGALFCLCVFLLWLVLKSR
ncbi:hypothetical protein LCGC14_0322690 [marine sediment metagenome]|uniref:Uncharacterized protein n=1 Tax=marine sediment metagenome TaxID=412755 RepID=A0A0F9TIH3_9ZZZZ